MLDASIDRHHLTMFVSIGLINGVYIRTVLDPTTGQLTDTRTRFLGGRPVSLVRTRVHGDTAVLALSTRTWLTYTLNEHIQFTPLMFDALTHVSSFHTELCPDGLLGITGDTLRILTVPQMNGTQMKMDSLPLSYTPRKMAVHPHNASLFYVIESDHRTVAAGAEYDAARMGPVRADPGRWVSCIRVVDAVTMSTCACVELPNDEAAFSITLVPLAACQNEWFLIVGSTQSLTHKPRAMKTAFLSTYRLACQGRQIELMHKTEVDDVPLALHAFHGRLLAGIGMHLRIYDMGTKKLLRKCQSRPFPSTIVRVSVQGHRIIVGDSQESVHYVVYKPGTNNLISFADDIMPRWTTALLMLDYDTVMAGDKFGNVYVLRIDSSTSMSSDEDPNGLMLQNERAYLMGAAHRAQVLAHFHIGDIISSLALESLVPGGRPVAIYTCINGTIGALIPFISREDVRIFSTLEMHMRQEKLSVTGRDHLAYRGQFAPVKSVVDGDLCELYMSLSHEKQEEMAEELGHAPNDIGKKLTQMRESTTEL